MRTLLLLALLLPASLSAQTTPDSFRIASLTVHADAPSPAPLIGTYATDDATLHVARSGRSLVLTLAGQPAFDAFTPRQSDVQRPHRSPPPRRVRRLH